MSQPARLATLAAWLARLEALRPEHIVLGLERVRQVMAQMALPARLPMPTILIAGTNGKGSAAAYLEAICRCAGYRVGCYTSPHLWHYNERIRVNGKVAEDTQIITAFEQIEMGRGNVALTYFEFGTLAAIQIFLQAQVDVAILEIGMGGRLDAVNAFEPDLSLIMSIGLDHCAWLGADRDSIGREKAGILRSGVAAVCADQHPPPSIQIRANALTTPLQQAGRDFWTHANASDWHWHSPQSNITHLPYPKLVGAHQIGNAAACIAGLNAIGDKLPIRHEAITAGLKQATLPGRFQHIPGQPPIILDVAHNPDATQALAATLIQRGQANRIIAIVGMLADKDQAATLAPLVPLVKHWQCIDLDGPRGLQAQALAQVLSTQGVASVGCHQGVTQALAAARTQATPDDIILIFGSFHTLAQYPSSLSDLKEIGCKFAWPVHISPFF